MNIQVINEADGLTFMLLQWSISLNGLQMKSSVW